MSEQEKPGFIDFQSKDLEILQFATPLFDSVVQLCRELSDDRIVRLNKKRFLLIQRILQVVKEVSTVRDYANQQIPSDYGYLSGYRQLDPVSEQLQKLQKLFPNIPLSVDLSIAQEALPEGAEGYLVIPRFELVAPTYEQAVETVLNLLITQRHSKFRNFVENRLGPEYLRQHPDAVEFWQKIEEQQPNKTAWVVPVQLGLAYVGCSENRSRYLFDVAGQVGLGAYHVAIALLTHPKRLQDTNDLWIDCPGDEYSSDGDALFDRAPRFFFFNDGVLEFGASVCRVLSHSGSASAFPRSILGP